MVQPPPGYEHQSQDDYQQPNDPYQRWIHVLNNENRQNFYGDENWQDDTMPPTMRLHTPPELPAKERFRAWSMNAKIATGTFSLIFLVFVAVLFTGIGPSKGRTNTNDTNSSTQVPTASSSVVNSRVPTATPISTPTPTNTTAAHKQQLEPLTTPLPTLRPTLTPTPLPTLQPTPTLTPMPTPTPLPTPTPILTPTPLPTPTPISTPTPMLTPTPTIDLP